jgi:chromosomal replication initiator protein
MDNTRLWETVLSNIATTISQASLSTWFREARIIRREEGTVYVGVPNNFILDWISTKFHPTLLRNMREISSDIRAIEYIVVKEGTLKKHENQKPQPAPNNILPLQDLYVTKEDGLNPRYTFDSFVVGSFNELAHAAAQAVVKNPGRVYNPFFVYGNTGLGKTHLMQAIGNQIKKNFPQKKIHYLTSEKFGLDYSTALTQGKANDFKQKYRAYDVLIMDDIQFFSSKEKFQEELFHLFNIFHDNNKQFVFSSDKHPHHIPELEERLRSRFGAGMIVDIPAPDLESRMSILRAKANFHNVILENEVLEFLASNVETSIRELEGILNSIIMHVQLKGRAPNINEIKNLIKNTAKPKKNVSVKEVIKIISEFYGVEEASIFDKTRKKEVVKPRQIIMYILREDFNISYPSIGEKLGGRDHTTIIHSCEKIKNNVKDDSALAQEISQIRSMMT